MKTNKHWDYSPTLRVSTPTRIPREETNKWKIRKKIHFHELERSSQKTSKQFRPDSTLQLRRPSPRPWFPLWRRDRHTTLPIRTTRPRFRKKKKTLMADSLEKGLPHAISRVPASLAALSSLRLRYKAEPQRVSWALRKGFRYAGDNTRITPLFFEALDVQAFGTVWHRGSLEIDV